MNFQETLDRIYSSCKNHPEKGTIATYIPELGKINPDKFGMHVLTANKETFAVGDAHERFSIQSISKVFALTQAMSFVGDDIWKRINVEPSGDPFNFLSLLELEKGIPRNPFINAGAIVVCDILVSHLKNPKQDFLNFVRRLANDDSIDYDRNVAKSEEKTGFRNIAAANLLKSFGNIKNDVHTVLDFYFHQCALAMSCAQLSKAFYIYINRGKCTRAHSFLSVTQIKRINALLLSCGFYDEAGEFAFRVGLPGKSGVGGGIVAVLPNKYCISTWSPGLNEKGNSLLGMLALEQFTSYTGLSIF